jgi:hypothetical protein
MPEFNPTVIEESSKRSSILIATAVLIVIAALVYFFNRDKHPEVTFTSVKTYTARTEMSAIKGSMNVIGSAPHIDTDLYVVINLKFTNRSHQPMFIKDETAVLTAPDHSILDTEALRPGDLPNVCAAFPDLQALSSKPLVRDTQINPGQTVEGMVLLHFPGATEANWNPRESATLRLDFFHQPSEIIKIP